MIIKLVYVLLSETSLMSLTNIQVLILIFVNVTQRKTSSQLMILRYSSSHDNHGTTKELPVQQNEPRKCHRPTCSAEHQH